jgi:hypothetical protein
MCVCMYSCMNSRGRVRCCICSQSSPAVAHSKFSFVCMTVYMYVWHVERSDHACTRTDWHDCVSIDVHGCLALVLVYTCVQLNV